MQALSEAVRTSPFSAFTRTLQILAGFIRCTTWPRGRLVRYVGRGAAAVAVAGVIAVAAVVALANAELVGVTIAALADTEASVWAWADPSAKAKPRAVSEKICVIRGRNIPALPIGACARKVNGSSLPRRICQYFCTSNPIAPLQAVGGRPFGASATLI